MFPKAWKGNKYFLCCDYNPQSGETEKVWLIMSNESEIEGKWSGGDVIHINGQEYVLGPREQDKRNGLSMFEVVSRDFPGLSL